MAVGSLVGQLTRIIVERVSSGSTKTFCISFSLGAHLCGFIGKEYKLTGIIAMDPAKPIFEGSSDDGRLSKKDAEVVFVFHTHAEWTGVKKPIGHVDFYVNGGKTQAVYCGRLQAVCNHMFSYGSLFRFANRNFCGTSVFCPLQNAKSIKGIKFPQIDVKNQAVKSWTTLKERSGVTEKEVIPRPRTN